MMGVPLLDPVAALLVSGMIVKAGLETGYQRQAIDVPSGLYKISASFIARLIVRHCFIIGI